MLCSNELLDFTYRIAGTGWAYLKLVTTHGDREIIIEYTCDPLPELIRALTKIYTGEADFARINLVAGNTAHDIVISNMCMGVLRVEVFEDAYFEVYEPESDKRIPMPELTVYTHIYNLCELFSRSVNNMINEIGVEDYNERWGCGMYTFPIAELEELNNLFRR